MIAIAQPYLNNKGNICIELVKPGAIQAEIVEAGITRL